MPVFAPKSNLNSIFIPYFDWEGGLAQPVVTSFWPQIGPQLQTRMCTEQEKMLPTGFKLRRCVLCICEQRQAFKTACFYLPPFILDEHGFRVCLGKVAKLT